MLSKPSRLLTRLVFPSQCHQCGNLLFLHEQSVPNLFGPPPPDHTFIESPSPTPRGHHRSLVFSGFIFRWRSPNPLLCPQIWRQLSPRPMLGPPHPRSTPITTNFRTAPYPLPHSHPSQAAPPPGIQPEPVPRARMRARTSGRRPQCPGHGAIGQTRAP